MDEAIVKSLEAIRSTQLEANDWRTDMRVDLARIEETVKSFCRDEQETHKNLDIMRTDLSALRESVGKITTVNTEKIDQLEKWKSGLWPRAIGILAIVQAGMVWFLKH